MKPRAATWAFLLLLGVQLAGLAFQAPGRRPEESNLLESLGLAILGPIGQAVQWAVTPLATGIENTRDLLYAREEAIRLRAEVQTLARDRQRLRELELEIESLARLLEFDPPGPLKTHTASVLHYDLTSPVRSLIVDSGRFEARGGLPVLTERGLVGRVLATRGRFTKVQLLTDSAFHAAVELQKSRRQGIARGDGRSGLYVDYVSRTVSVERDETVVTAGTDGIFPRGVPVGFVVEVNPASEHFHAIRARPFVDLLRLRHVLIAENPDWSLLWEGSPP